MNSTIAQASQLNVPLSHLVPSRRNPRRVKPAREAHHRLVALIRSQGLLQPLVVRPVEDKPKHFYVIAGHRRLAALREIHKGDGDPKIPCVLRDVDVNTADALSLGENFGQQAMHPLDEAEAFGKLAELRGPIYDPARETRKKSELVEALAVLFADAAEGKLEDKKLAERVNGWIPANLRDSGPLAA